MMHVLLLLYNTSINTDCVATIGSRGLVVIMWQDAKLAKLDNMDEDDLDKIREKRKAQLIAGQRIKQARPRGYIYTRAFVPPPPPSPLPTTEDARHNGTIPKP